MINQESKGPVPPGLWGPSADGSKVGPWRQWPGAPSSGRRRRPRGARRPPPSRDGLQARARATGRRRQRLRTCPGRSGSGRAPDATESPGLTPGRSASVLSLEFRIPGVYFDSFVPGLTLGISCAPVKKNVTFFCEVYKNINDFLYKKK